VLRLGIGRAESNSVIIEDILIDAVSSQNLFTIQFDINEASLFEYQKLIVQHFHRYIPSILMKDGFSCQVEMRREKKEENIT
jgi:hypothetical protein